MPVNPASEPQTQAVTKRRSKASADEFSEEPESSRAPDDTPSAAEKTPATHVPAPAKTETTVTKTSASTAKKTPAVKAPAKKAAAKKTARKSA